MRLHSVGRNVPFDYLGGTTDNRGVRRHVLDDYRSRADNAPFADNYIRQNDAARSQEASFLDMRAAVDNCSGTQKTHIFNNAFVGDDGSDVDQAVAPDADTRRDDHPVLNHASHADFGLCGIDQRMDDGIGIYSKRVQHMPDSLSRIHRAGHVVYHPNIAVRARIEPGREQHRAIAHAALEPDQAVRRQAAGGARDLPDLVRAAARARPRLSPTKSPTPWKISGVM